MSERRTFRRIHSSRAAFVAFAVLVIALAWLAAGCGDDAGYPNTEAGLKTAIKEQTEAFFTMGSAKQLYRAYAKECRDKVAYGDFAPSLLVARGFFEGIYEVKLKDVRVESVEVRNFKPGSAEARTFLKSNKDPDINLNSKDEKWRRYLYEGDTWVQSDCSTMSLDFNDS